MFNGDFKQMKFQTEILSLMPKISTITSLLKILWQKFPRISIRKHSILFDENRNKSKGTETTFCFSQFSIFSHIFSVVPVCR